MDNRQEPPAAPDTGRPQLAVSWEANFAQRMKRMREARGMTQTDLARQVSKYNLPFHQPTVQRIEAGERPIRLNEAFVIAEILKVDFPELIKPDTPLNYEVYGAVQRINVASSWLVDKVGVAFDDWIEHLLPFINAMKERLSQYADTATADDLDQVTRWGLAWAYRVESIYNDLASSVTSLARIAGYSPSIYETPTEQLVEYEHSVLHDSVRLLLVWCERFRGSELDSPVSPAQLMKEFPGG
ncbi:helix-turn-helix transcriptional regulator [Acrocarpospora phusangensis]|uniref:helix-turn-helix transcriptional regulator n=1 Tax=Acrocarpospora phusangensis TaxID=1070424 RepID=UPI00194F1DC4|nr:helix-turn-helix transcriptional regulator [Acrocarpospora phusangensis]